MQARGGGSEARDLQPHGVLAQSGERLDGIQEAAGAKPADSTHTGSTTSLEREQAEGLGCLENSAVPQGTGVQDLLAPKNEHGLVAQPVEHLLDTQKVVGAHPTEPIRKDLDQHEPPSQMPRVGQLTRGRSIPSDAAGFYPEELGAIPSALMDGILSAMAYGETLFEGRSIFLVSKGYPAVYWPGHPAANAANIVSVHRAIAFERFGEDIRDKHVHHKNGDVWDWTIDNLQPMTPEDHGREHGCKPVECECRGCGRSFLAPMLRRSKRIYCTAQCRLIHTTKIQWPETTALWNMAIETGYEATGRLLGVTGTAVKKRLRSRGYAAGRTPRSPIRSNTPS